MSDESRMTVLCFQYTNHRGVTERRRVRPLRVWHGASEWHEGWHMDAHCLDRDATRSFAMAKMSDIEEEAACGPV